MPRRWVERPRESGTLLVILLILVIVVAMAGVWMLRSSQTGIMKAGHFRGTTRLMYLAEEGLQKAINRIQAIADPATTDPLYAQSLYPSPELDMNNLINVYDPAAPGIVINPPCPEPFDPDAALNAVYVVSSVTSNVVCNFLGSTLPDTQVILVRQLDHIEESQRLAVFLVNTIGRDATGRKTVVQGVAVVPYFCQTIGYPSSGCSMPVGMKPYLASIKKAGAE